MPSEPPTTAISTETLYEIIGAIAEGPTLDRVLRAVVDLLVHATDCHACFIYLREGDRLRIRAASPVFEHVVGSVVLGMDEGLTGWVARNRCPAFIREAAMDDPRMKYVPELQEERFQSMIAVPLNDRRGDVTGVVVLNTEAPREFGQDVLDLLVHVASLVVGAIDNAQLYERTQHQVTALSTLNSLSQRMASLTTRDELHRAGCDGIAALMRAERCALSLLDVHGAAIEIASTRHADRQQDGLLAHAPTRGQLTGRLLDTGRVFGLVEVSRSEPFSDDDSRLLETATSQLALALRTAELIERLTTENRVRALFDALEDQQPGVAVRHARAMGWGDGRGYMVLVAVPAADTAVDWDAGFASQLEQRLRVISANALIDLSQDGLRALVPLSQDLGAATDRLSTLRSQLDLIGRELGVGFGLGPRRTALSDGRQSLQHATDAARVTIRLEPAGGARIYEELGPYRFLVGLLDAAAPDRSHEAMLSALAEHDQTRGTQLIDTLEAYLAARGVVRATAEALYIHPNTLRQRLERIETLTGLDFAAEDLLSLELSLKLNRLHTVPPSAT